MGTATSSNVMDSHEYAKKYETLKCDRLIDAENHIYVGIVCQNNQNSLSGQAIRIGTGNIKRLEQFIETPTQLIYEFETNTVMTLSKKDNEVIVNISEPDTNVHLQKPMHTMVRTFSKEINWNSTELDKIVDFIQPE